MRQWNSIAIPLSLPWPTRAISTPKQLSITLPLDAVEMIDNGLIPLGLYGKKLATGLRQPDP
jgi:hypothetical protein